MIEIEGASKTTSKIEEGVPISIKNPSETLQVYVEEDDTILHLKEKIAKKVALTDSNQKLVFHGRQLRDDNLVSDYGVVADSLVYWAILYSHHQSRRSAISLEVSSTSNIGDVKAKIQDARGTERARQALFLNGQLLSDEDTLASRGITSGTTLSLGRRLIIS